MTIQDDSKDLITEIVGTPFFFYRNLGFLLEGATTVLMLSMAMRWSAESNEINGGWFCKSQAEWEDATLLTRSEQDTARKQLRTKTFWQEERRGLPAKLFFRVDFVELIKDWNDEHN